MKIIDSRLLSILLGGLLSGCNITVSEKSPDQTGTQAGTSTKTSTATGTQAGTSTKTSTATGTQTGSSVQYLLFQAFLAGEREDGQSVRGFVPTADYQTTLNPSLSSYADMVKKLVQDGSYAPVGNRRYGMAFGPLPLDLPDQDLVNNIKIGFDVAIAKKIPVAFHLDVSHFWKLAKDNNGNLLSAGDTNKEWKDFSGAIADPDHWQQGLLPSMCFECPKVQETVDRVSGKVAFALKDGIARLKAAGDEGLFAGVIIGWEAGSDNPVRYHSLSLKGYKSTSSSADINKASQQILHDYLLRWTKPLVVSGGVPKAKVYTHTAGGTDYWWVPFSDYAIGGFSMYPAGYGDDEYSLVAAAADKAGSAWGMCEGTNTDVEGKPLNMSWETYLGRIYNHGGTLAALFGLTDATTSVDGYGRSTGGDEAKAAYRKFLSGGALVEGAAVPVPTATSTSTATSTTSSTGTGGVCPSPLPSGTPSDVADLCSRADVASAAGGIHYPAGPIQDVSMLRTLLSQLFAAQDYANLRNVLNLVLGGGGTGTSTSTATSTVTLALETKQCNVMTPDNSLLPCHCPAGKVATGGACWIFNGVGVVSAKYVSADAYYCAGSLAGAGMGIFVNCANTQ